MDGLSIKNFSIEILNDVDISMPGGYWKNDKILIYDPCKRIKDSDIIYIIEYLYCEGFVQDRRTPYEINDDVS